MVAGVTGVSTRVEASVMHAKTVRKPGGSGNAMIVKKQKMSAADEFENVTARTRRSTISVAMRIAPVEKVAAEGRHRRAHGAGTAQGWRAHQ